MALVNGTANPDTLLGTIDPDVINGLGSDDVLYGFDGSDILDGGIGDDFLYGGSSDDTLIGGAGEDFFYGQSGIDTASYATAAGAFILNLNDPFLSTGDATGDFFFSVERFILGGFADTFIGNGSANHARGAAGSDTLLGGGGNDQLFGEGNDDTLDGGTGADTLNGGAGIDTASYLSALGAVTIDLLAPANTTGDAVGDVYTGIERIELTNFGDLIILEGVIHSADGAGGADTMFGGGAADTLSAGSGNDILHGGGGADVLDGGSNDDTLFSGSGADTLNGGDGIDSAIYTDSVIKIDMVAPGNNTGTAAGDTFNSIERLVFTGTKSTYIGGAQAMTVVGNSTTSTFFAGSGAEEFISEFSNSDNMTVSYARATSAVTLTALQDRLIGTGGANGDEIEGARQLILSTRADTLNLTGFTGTPLQSINSGGGNDNLTLGIDQFLVINAGNGSDTIAGALLGGTIEGGIGDDTIALDGSESSGSSIVVTDADGSEIISLASYGVAAVTTGDGVDDITVTALNFTISAGSNDDILDVSMIGLSSIPTNVVDGGIGNDDITVTMFGGTVTGDDGNDVITASGAFFSIDGGDGDDQMDVFIVVIGFGGSGVTGGDGDDTINLTLVVPVSVFSPSFSTVIGGNGNDQISGFNSDPFGVIQILSFECGPNWGSDVISNFRDGVDRITFNGTAGSGLDDFSDLTVSGDGTFTLITFGTDQIFLSSFDVANFSAADVFFV